VGTLEEWPLARLLALGTRTLVDGLHSRLAARGWPHVRQGSGYVLLGIRPQAMTVNEVAALLGVTKQASSKLISFMEDDGLVASTPHPDDSRARLIRLTPRGTQFLETVEEIYEELEAEWAARIGQDRLDALRADLSDLLSVDGQFPPIRPTL
jgi:DNA-binding MarR family transcriptional regulator